MRFFIYLVWISLPVALMAFGGMMRLVACFVKEGRKAAERARSILRASLFVFVCGLLCFIIDRYWLSQSAPDVIAQHFELVLLFLYPVVILAGLLLVSIGYFLASTARSDRFAYDTHQASGSSFWFLACLLLLGFIGYREYYEENEADHRVVSEYKEKLKRTSIDFPSLKEISPSSLGKQLVDRVQSALWGSDVEKSASGKVEEAGRRPDFNSEGHNQFGEMAMRFAENEKVDPQLVLAIIEVGSGYHQYWEDSVGRSGLMRVFPSVVAVYGASDVFDPVQNVASGTRYLKFLIQKYNGDLKKVLDAYEAGELPDGSEIGKGKTSGWFVEEVIRVYQILKEQAAK